MSDRVLSQITSLLSGNCEYYLEGWSQFPSTYELLRRSTFTNWLLPKEEG